MKKLSYPPDNRSRGLFCRINDCVNRQTLPQDLHRRLVLMMQHRNRIERHRPTRKFYEAKHHQLGADPAIRNHASEPV